MRLTTIGEACRLILRATLAKTLAWEIERTREDLRVGEMKHQLALP